MLGQRRAMVSCFSLVIAHKWDNVPLQMQPVYNDDLVERSNGFIPVRRRSFRATNSREFSPIWFKFTLENNLSSVLKLLYVQPRRMGGGGQIAAGVYIPAASYFCGFSNTSFFHIKPFLAGIIR